MPAEQPMTDADRQAAEWADALDNDPSAGHEVASEVATLATAPATVEQLLSFKPGDFVELDLESLIQAKVDGVPVFDCHYCTSNKHYAIKIDQLLTGSLLGWLGETTLSA